MLTLCMDTSNKYLGVSLIENDKVIAKYQEICFKKQSEMIFKVIDDLFKESNKTNKDIDNIVITKGPGSYTGVRIAMTIAKVIGSISNKKIYTLDTLKLYSGNNENIGVIMDARANRVYYGKYNKGKTLINPTIKNIEDIDLDENLCGDLSLFSKEDVYFDFSKSFLDLKDEWELVENVDLLVPLYLKDEEAYLK